LRSESQDIWKLRVEFAADDGWQTIAPLREPLSLPAP